MDRNKSVFSPRNLIICVTTCTVIAVWAIICTALYFYFFGVGPPPIEGDVTEQRSIFMYRQELLPWYLNGSIQPSSSKNDDKIVLWPFQLPAEDPLQRLQNQLMFLPKGSEEIKIVLFWTDWSPKEVQEYQCLLNYLLNKRHRLDSGLEWALIMIASYMTSSRHSCFEVNKTEYLLCSLSGYSETCKSPKKETHHRSASQCPVKSCVFTNSRRSFSKASAVVFRNPMKLLQDFPQESRPHLQVWVFNSLSRPEGFVHPRDVFNWTSTPRLDSDIPMFPNGIWMYYNPSWKHQKPPLNLVNHKTLGAAMWFPTSCEETSPAYRYVHRLSHHTLVDMFSSPNSPCGDQCPQNNSEICLKLLQNKYRVTLVLDHYNCNHTISDMFFVALESDTVPVVMYPPRSIYEQVVPEGSFIHTDDFASPQDLAKHLELIYEDDSVFNSYLSWKGTGFFVKSWYCRLCALLHHNNLPNLVIEDVNQWWNPEGECYS